MDPEAKVIISGRDATAAAFSSADKNLKQFQRTATNVRQLLGSFGVVFSARAFLSWINGAVSAADATGEHAETVKATKDAMEAMKNASDSLALSVANSLTPAMQGLTAVFTGWNRLISGADPFQFEARIESLRSQLHVMGQQFRSSGGMSDEWKKKFLSDMDAVQKELDELLEKQRAALGLDMGPAFRQGVQMRNAVEGMKRIGDVYGRFSGLKRPDIELDELFPLDGLEEIVVDARQMTVDELLKPFPSAEVARLFEPIKSEGETAAAFIGENFRDAFASWLGGAEHGFRDLLKRMAAEMATSALFKGLASMFTGGGGASNFFSSFFGGARADGGPVSAGKVYKVGERGEELFAPGVSGSIIPNHALGGGMTINVDARGAMDPAAVQAAVERGVIAAVTMSDARMNAKIGAIYRPSHA
jgi:hypothetical protein